MKNILFIASEGVPFIKTGGLADVVGSLPKYFNKDEFDVRVILPKYVCIKEEYKSQMTYLDHFYINLAWRSQYVGVFMMEYIPIKPISLSSWHISTDPPIARVGIPFCLACLNIPAAVLPVAV